MLGTGTAEVIVLMFKGFTFVGYVFKTFIIKPTVVAFFTLGIRLF